MSYDKMTVPELFDNVPAFRVHVTKADGTSHYLDGLLTYNSAAERAKNLSMGGYGVKTIIEPCHQIIDLIDAVWKAAASVPVHAPSKQRKGRLLKTA